MRIDPIFINQNVLNPRKRPNPLHEGHAKVQQKKMYPVLGQNILFKEIGSETWKKAKVFRVFKKSSMYSNVKQLDLEDGSQTEKNFDTEIEEWKPLDDDCPEPDVDAIENFYLSSMLNGDASSEIDDVYRVELIDKKEFGRADVQIAMKSEIQKYKSFEAFEEVDDKGQESIPIRWVVTK